MDYRKGIRSEYIAFAAILDAIEEGAAPNHRQCDD
jgi:hypothetical protein